MKTWDIYLSDEKWVSTREMSSFFERLSGFMGRKLEDLNVQTLWFPDCPAVHTCFMRFPIDLYFLDGDHKILAAHKDVGAWRYISQKGADSVLEIPSGQIDLVDVEKKLRFQKCQ